MIQTRRGRHQPDTVNNQSYQDEEMSNFTHPVCYQRSNSDETEVRWRISAKK